MKTIKPAIGTPNNYSKQQQILWESIVDKYLKMDSGEVDYEKLSAKEKTLIDSMEMNGAGPLTQWPGDCSWYCGGEMYKVTSDFYLNERRSAFISSHCHHG